MPDTKPAKSDLFKAYREKAAEIKAAEEATQSLRAEASEVIADIVKHHGPGPYKLDGCLVKARKAKAELGGLYSFLSQNIEAEEV